jgi:hypothetical protein
MSVANFPVWETVTLGIFRTPEEYREELKKRRLSISVWSRHLFDDQFPRSYRTINLDLVLVTPWKLGVRKRTSYEEICHKAVSKGLTLCPAECGPALRLQSKQLPNDEPVHIGMKPIEWKTRHKFTWSVSNGCVADLFDRSIDYGLDPGDKITFALPYA